MKSHHSTLDSFRMPLGCFIFGGIHTFAKRCALTRHHIHWLLTGAFCGSLTSFSSWIQAATVPLLQSDATWKTWLDCILILWIGYVTASHAYTLGAQIVPTTLSPSLETVLSSPSTTLPALPGIWFLLLVWQTASICIIWDSPFTSSEPNSLLYALHSYVWSGWFAPIGAWIRMVALSRWINTGYPWATLIANWLGVIVVSIASGNTDVVSDNTVDFAWIRQGLIQGLGGSLSTLSSVVHQVKTMPELRYYILLSTISAVLLASTFNGLRLIS